MVVPKVVCGRLDKALAEARKARELVLGHWSPSYWLLPVPNGHLHVAGPCLHAAGRGRSLPCGDRTHGGAGREALGRAPGGTTNPEARTNSSPSGRSATIRAITGPSPGSGAGP